MRTEHAHLLAQGMYMGMGMLAVIRGDDAHVQVRLERLPTILFVKAGTREGHSTEAHDLCAARPAPTPSLVPALSLALSSSSLTTQ